MSSHRTPHGHPHHHHHRDPHADSGILTRGLMLLVLGGLVVRCWCGVSQTRRKRREGRSPTLPHVEQRWEGEGGRPLPDESGLPPDSPSPEVPAPRS